MSKLAGRKVQLPYSLHRDIAVLDGYLGVAGPAHVFSAKLSNLPALIAEMMVAGESDPNLFQIDYKFTIGKPIPEPGVVDAIRRRADALWAEYRAQETVQRGSVVKLHERYLRVIDSRLLENPGLAVKAPAHQGGASTDASRLIGEDKALRRLNHRNIVRRYARVEDPSLGPCLLLEHVQGKTLDRIWRRRVENRQGPLPLSAVAHIAYQLAHALSHAHQQGVVHGELHPANILIEEPAGGKAKGVVKLAGFGGGGGAGGAGALPYSAPEQIRDGKPGPATDVYQLGATLFVLATGRLPYEAEGPDELRQRLLSQDPHPSRVHHIRPEISPRFEALIEGAREKDLAKRWALPKLVEELTQLYASKGFTLDDTPRGSIAEELVVRAQTDLALRDFYRALEALDLAKDFLDGVPGERGAEVRRKFDTLRRQVEPHREAVEAVRAVQKKHIVPVDHFMEELYARYGNGQPILTDAEKGVMSGDGDDAVIVKRSLIDGILQHTHAAIQELAGINADLVGDMHRRMVDRASSQEEACSDLAKRMIQFGEDYRRGSK